MGLSMFIVLPLGIGCFMSMFSGYHEKLSLIHIFDVQPGQRGIPPQSGQVLGDADGHPSRFDLRKHGLKTGAVVVGAAVPIVS